MASAHDKIIAAAAKSTLQPLGLRRKGQSRLWIGDHGWWLAVVEFQPSGFEKGSYLNVAAHWLWSNTGYITFDLGGGADHGSRAAGFEAYRSEAQFEEAASKLAEIAAQEVQNLTARLRSVNQAADFLVGRERTARSGSWPAYNAGIAAGLAGRLDEADVMLSSVTDLRVKDIADRYASLTSDATRFREEAIAQIGGQREALRLSDIDLALPNIRSGM
ncbi:hypothetical protein [Phenylobacterium sp.]|uniref:hypothetical protein n=1 Tax=Phenylobacterium sp. TaxID=1871053 RepID=UPI0035C84337